MKCLIEKFLSGARNYGVMDFGMLKISMILIGIIVGAYFSEFFLSYKTILWIVAIACCLSILAITIKKSIKH
ncbi:MAG: hypothetical protein GX664_07725 [Bacteroidales bacterium]|nr:hypothetical protein [Bacteroidales bacterium]